MNLYFTQIFLILLSFSCNLFSQNNNSDSLSIFEFRWSNDFEYQTDYYYTNGFAFEVFAPCIAESPVNLILLKHSSNDFVLYGATMLQDIFTPKAKFYIPDQLNGDRPFASYILLGVKKISFNRKNRVKLYSELQIGVLGPAALGEEVQNGIHKLLPTSSKVNGWENQISNSLMINYSAYIEKNILFSKLFETSGILLAQLGLPFTNVGFGLQTRIGVFNILPSGFEFLSKRKWEMFLTLSAMGKIIGYNATLQGGLFSESVYTLNEINRFVGYASIGFTAIYKCVKLEYVQNFNTPEFSNALYHSWGYLSIKIKF